MQSWMASTAVDDDQESHFMCQICFERFTPNSDERRPRSLHCGHTFCSFCLSALIVKNSVRCPNDRQDTFLEKGKGVESLKPNYLVSKLMDSLPGKSVVKCQAKDGCVFTATLWCQKCEASICDSCNEDIHIKSNIGFTRKHKTEAFEEKSSYANCEEHDEPLKLYCENDSKLVCSYCTLFGEHKGHKVQLIKDAAQARRERNKLAISELQGCLKSLEKVSKTIIQHTMSNKEYHHKIEENIKSNIDKLKTLLDKQQRLLLKNIHTHMEKQDDDVQKMRMKNAELISTMEARVVEFSIQNQCVDGKLATSEETPSVQDLVNRAKKVVDVQLVNSQVDLHFGEDVISQAILKISAEYKVSDVLIEAPNQDVHQPDGCFPATVKVSKSMKSRLNGVYEIQDQKEGYPYYKNYKSDRFLYYDTMWKISDVLWDAQCIATLLSSNNDPTHLPKRRVWRCCMNRVLLYNPDMNVQAL